MERYAFARVVHILGVVIWIGGVAMETTVLLPAIKRLKYSGPEAPVSGQSSGGEISPFMPREIVAMK